MTVVSLVKFLGSKQKCEGGTVKCSKNMPYARHGMPTQRPPHLASIVEGEPEEKDVREGLDYAEEPIHNPVGQPLCVVLLRCALNSLDPREKRSSSTKYPQIPEDINKYQKTINDCELLSTGMCCNVLISAKS